MLSYSSNSSVSLRLSECRSRDRDRIGYFIDESDSDLSDFFLSRLPTPTLLTQWLSLREYNQLFSFLSAQTFSPLRSAIRFITEEIRAKRHSATRKIVKQPQICHGFLMNLHFSRAPGGWGLQNHLTADFHTHHTHILENASPV